MSTSCLVGEAATGTEGAMTGGGTAITDAARYLTFTLNGEAFALSIFTVTEVLACHSITPVPMLPDFVRGVINLRGRAVPVIDLAIRFTRGVTTLGRRTSIVIVHIGDDQNGEGGQDVGILVDAVNKVEAFAAEDIEPPPAVGTGLCADVISGMARRADDFVIVLDTAGMLSRDDAAALQAVAGAAPPADGGESTGS